MCLFDYLSISKETIFFILWIGMDLLPVKHIWHFVSTQLIFRTETDKEYLNCISLCSDY